MIASAQRTGASAVKFQTYKSGRSPNQCVRHVEDLVDTRKLA